MDLQLIMTADGSHSLYNPKLEEIYHSVNGALAESDHVFIRAGFDHSAAGHKTINLLEVGFGTGLNALLTALRCQTANVPVKYLTLEPFPVDPTLIRQLNYPHLLPSGAEAMWHQIHACPWGKWAVVHERFQIQKIREKIEDHPLPAGHFNLVYFDAFAPGIQGELWQAGIFSKLRDAMSENSTFVTYSAKGAVRRNLAGAGFHVERLPGPKRKREMIRAKKTISG